MPANHRASSIIAPSFIPSRAPAPRVIPCSGALGATPHRTCFRGQPAEARVPPRGGAATRRHGDPMLLAVDHETVTAAVGTGRHLAGSAAGTRFGDADRRLV